MAGPWKWTWKNVQKRLGIADLCDEEVSVDFKTASLLFCDCCSVFGVFHMPSVFRLEACSLLFINVISPTPHLFRQARMCTHSCFKMMPLRWSQPGPCHHWTPFHARFLFPLSKHSAVSIHQASFHVFQFILHFCDQCFSSLTLSADLVLVACHSQWPTNKTQVSTDSICGNEEHLQVFLNPKGS